VGETGLEVCAGPASVCSAPGAIWEPAGSEGGGSVSSIWSATSGPDGLYQVRATAADEAGNRASGQWTQLRVDRTAATGGLALAPGATLTGAVSLRGTASDPGGSGVKDVSAQSCPVAEADTCAGPWATRASGQPLGDDVTLPAFDSATLADGRYALRFRFTDYAGNTSTSSAVVVLVRNARAATGAATAAAVEQPGRPAATAGPPAGSPDVQPPLRAATVRLSARAVRRGSGATVTGSVSARNGWLLVRPLHGRGAARRVRLSSGRFRFTTTLRAVRVTYVSGAGKTGRTIVVRAVAR
jgi:hypothetical protein